MRSPSSREAIRPVWEGKQTLKKSLRWELRALHSDWKKGRKSNFGPCFLLGLQSGRSPEAPGDSGWTWQPWRPPGLTVVFRPRSGAGAAPTPTASPCGPEAGLGSGASDARAAPEALAQRCCSGSRPCSTPSSLVCKANCSLVLFTLASPGPD